jgi:hypothetical protein
MERITEEKMYYKNINGVKCTISNETLLYGASLLWSLTENANAIFCATLSEAQKTILREIHGIFCQVAYKKTIKLIG